MALVVAFDERDKRRVLELADQLAGVAPWAKIGLELFIAQGPSILTDFKERGFKIFLDLKFYDIPNTVERATRAALELGADALTAHVQAGKRACEAALATARETRPEAILFGVTALTSFAPGEMPLINQSPDVSALELAKLAGAWKLPGVVCSGREATAVKSVCPELLCLCPGIRPANASGDDQRRAVSPAEAVRAGADFIVVGRPITASPRPALVARQILAEIAGAKAGL